MSARPEGQQSRIIRNLQKYFLYSVPTGLEVLVIIKAADPNLHITRKHRQRILKDVVEEEDIIVVLNVLPKCFRKKQVLVPKITATEM